MNLELPQMTSNHFICDQIEAVKFESGINMFMASLQSATGSFPFDYSPIILPVDFGELRKSPKVEIENSILF